MNDLELNANFLAACFYYAYNIGPYPDDAFVHIGYDSPNFVIRVWNHSSTEPTRTNLKVPTVQQIEDIFKISLKKERSTIKDPPNIKGNFVINLSGPWASTTQLTLSYNLVEEAATIKFPQIDIIGNSNSADIFTTDLFPIIIRPESDTCFVILIKDNSIHKFGLLDIKTNGTFHIHSDQNMSKFSSNTGQNGYPSFAASYIVT